jgi:hypothetical protein
LTCITRNYLFTEQKSQQQRRKYCQFFINDIKCSSNFQKKPTTLIPSFSLPFPPLQKLSLRSQCVYPVKLKCMICNFMPKCPPKYPPPAKKDSPAPVQWKKLTEYMKCFRTSRITKWNVKASRITSHNST